MTIVILFGLENVMRAGLICLSNVEHAKWPLGPLGTKMSKALLSIIPFSQEI